MIVVCSRKVGVEQPIHHLTMTMFRDGASAKPKFKGKAAETRRFLPVLLEMVAHCFSMDSEHAQTRYYCLKALQDCYTEMKEWRPPTSVSRIAGHCRRHLLLWATLKEATRDPLLWCFYPKHHLMMHCAESTTNPLLEWNYSDESEIGESVKVAAGCNVPNLPLGLMQKYWLTFEAP